MADVMTNTKLESIPLPGSPLTLSVGGAPYIMGIVNVTPDSFSDGGRYLDARRAIAHGLDLLAQGAHILDIGGESTRPGAEPVSEQEELDRVMPVIEGLLLERPDVVISIDTTKARVAEDASKAGARIINDVSSMEHDPRMATVAAERGAALILMHRRGTPKTMQRDTHYDDDLITTLLGYFQERIAFAVSHGVKPSRIILDPGIGFGKSTAQNCELIDRLGELIEGLDKMVLLGPSRKSFIGHLLQAEPGERLYGTAASVACGVMRGAHIVRVHDVAQMVQVARVASAILDASRASDLP